MNKKNQYVCLQQQIFIYDDYKIIPIRRRDRYEIMNWRNEQLYHLRQRERLTKEKQDKYFEETISSLFNQQFPSQLLFSFFKNEQCVGYGGLVHINWTDKNAEISFIMNTELERKYFDKNWSMFLECLEQLAFGELSFHKIFVFAFDLRPHLYDVLVLSGYFMDARLKNHCLVAGEFKDVLIYSKLTNQ